MAALVCGAPVLWGVESHQAQSPAQLPAGLTVRTQSAGPIPSGWSPGRDSLTEGYRREALGLIIREANQAAQVLQLPEHLPICESNVVESFLSPLRYAQETGAIGTISTTNYCYCVSRSNKLCYILGVHQNTDCARWEQDYLWPVSRVDTNAAYQLATQWLAAVSIDVAGLNRDFSLSIETDNLYVRPPPGKFVPVYSVAWCKPHEQNPNIVYASGTPRWRVIASVRLFLPTKTLIQVRVEDPKYILRPPVTFSNVERKGGH